MDRPRVWRLLSIFKATPTTSMQPSKIRRRRRHPCSFTTPKEHRLRANRRPAAVHAANGDTFFSQKRGELSSEMLAWSNRT